jgi:hypothetical protein
MNDIENLTVMIFARLGLRELSKRPDERTYRYSPDLFYVAYDKAIEVMPESDGFNDMDPVAFIHALYVAVIAELLPEWDGPISGARARARSLLLDYFARDQAELIALELCEDAVPT